MHLCTVLWSVWCWCTINPALCRWVRSEASQCECIITHATKYSCYIRARPLGLAYHQHIIFNVSVIVIIIVFILFFITCLVLSSGLLGTTSRWSMWSEDAGMCCRVICAYYAYVTIHRTLGGTCFESRNFVNKVSVQHFSAENKQEAAECYYQILPVHSRGVIWKIKSKFSFLIHAEMNLVGKILSNAERPSDRQPWGVAVN